MERPLGVHIHCDLGILSRVELLHRIGLPAFALASLVSLLVWPVARHRRRAGTWPFSLRESSVEQALVGWLLTLVTSSFLVWIVLYGWLGADTLDVWRAPAWVAWIGWVALLVAFALVKTSQRHMGTSWRMGVVEDETKLVTHGVFEYSRNPIYSGILLGCLGVVCVTPSVWTCAGWLATLLAIELQARIEEQYLYSRKGAEYIEYAARVGRFVPGVGRLRRVGSPRSRSSRS